MDFSCTNDRARPSHLRLAYVVALVRVTDSSMLALASFGYPPAPVSDIHLCI
jgi:hypothetical protein